MQGIVGVSLVLGALGVIWAKAIRPGAKIISQAEQTIPMLAALTKEWHDAPNLPAMVKDIYDQFKTNSGSSLKDAVNRLEATGVNNTKHVEENRRLLVELQMELEVAKRIADNDRRIMDRLVELVNVLDARVKVGVQGVADIKTEQHGVAEHLAEAQHRADGVESTQPGEAADAAAKSSQS